MNANDLLREMLDQERARALESLQRLQVLIDEEWMNGTDDTRDGEPR